MIHDLLGINERVPKLAKKFADLRGVMTDAVEAFMREVEAGTFPDEDHSYDVALPTVGAALPRRTLPTRERDRDDGREDTLAERAALVSKLTHEIRGPVSTIRGLAGTTLAHYDRLDDGERREFLELIRHEAERLERTVEQVALALKLDAGSLRFDIRPQDLGVIVRGAADAAETGDHPLEVQTRRAGRGTRRRRSRSRS